MPDQVPEPKRGPRWPWLAGGSVAVVVVGLIGSAGLTGFTLRTVPPYVSWGAVTTTASPSPDASAYKTVVGNHIEVLVQQYDLFTTAVSASDAPGARAALAGMAAACVAFRAELDETPPPAELAGFDVDLRLALDDYETAGNTLLAAIDTQDASLVMLGQASLAEADGHLEDALVHAEAAA